MIRALRVLSAYPHCVKLVMSHSARLVGTNSSMLSIQHPFYPPSSNFYMRRTHSGT